jgi:hypothetical protein
MDYIFFSSLIGTLLLTIVASYDIACQWGINFWSRAKTMPENLQLPDWIDIIFKVPKFHLPPHVKKCHAPYSFNYTKGVGRTDGEGVERNWSWLNSSARSISVMGPGSREDTIDDLCGYSNWKKTVDLGEPVCAFDSFHLTDEINRKLMFEKDGAGDPSGHVTQSRVPRIHGRLARWTRGRLAQVGENGTGLGGGSRRGESVRVCGG